MTGAQSYTVTLYKGGVKVGDYTAGTHSYNFVTELYDGGTNTYTFTVTAISDQINAFNSAISAQSDGYAYKKAPIINAPPQDTETTDTETATF